MNELEWSIASPYCNSRHAATLGGGVSPVFERYTQKGIKTLTTERERAAQAVLVFVSISVLNQLLEGFHA
jgi:hypothetical protein